MPATLTVIGRNCFGRYDIVRERVQGEDCDWCGQTGNQFGKLYRYGHQPDSINGRINWARGTFCEYGCCKSFHG
jgi:hypothetical protein